MKNLNFSLVLMISVCLVFIACNAGNKHEAEEANIHKAYESLTKHDYATFTSLCSDDYTELSVGPKPIKGVKAAIEQYKVYFTAFPDAKFDVTDIGYAGKNQYFLKVHITGTNTGPFMMLPPTGKHIDIWDMDIVELNDAGKCITHYVCDPTSVLRSVGYGSITNPATGVVMQAYEAFGKKDIQSILSLCSDDVVFEVHDMSLDSKSNEYKGKEGVAKFFQDLGSKLTYTKFQPMRFIADGDDVVIFVSAEYKQNSSGKNYSANYDHYFRVVNGKIVYFKGIADIAKTM